MFKTNVIVSEKKWHKNLFLNLKNQYLETNWILIEQKNIFKINFLKNYDVNKIFIPHWSYLIKDEIYKNYECIIFHMTDLPFGRGGSPLQNLIVRNFKKTKISAIRVEKGIDTGPVYLKKDLDLGGTASEIFQRSSDIIYNMISQIIDNKIIPKPQKGRISKFKRRTPEQSNIFLLDDLSKVYDYIRMLDCDGYPKAFLESNKLKFEFSNVKFTSKNELKANVSISKK